MAPSPAQSPARQLKPGQPLTLAGIADGAEGLVIADLARAIAAAPSPPAISMAVVCRDGPRMALLSRALGFFAPDIEVLEFPAWDCLPYDRVSPHAAVVAQRMTALARLARVKGRDKPAVLLTTVNAILQRVPPREIVAKQSLSAAPGNVLPMAGIIQWLELNGFNRASTVREAGDYAVRGGIVDLYAPGMGDPVRLDFFGDSWRRSAVSIRTPSAPRRICARSIWCRWRNSSSPPTPSGCSAPATWRRSAPPRPTTCSTKPSAKAAATAAWSTGCRCSTRAWKRCSIICRQRRWRSNRWPTKPRTNGWRRSPTIIRRARRRRIRPAAGRPTSRCRRTGSISPKRNGANASMMRALARLTPFAAPEAANVIEIGAHAGRNFSAERATPNANVFEAVTAHVNKLQAAGKRALIALWSEGSRERMAHVLAEHHLVNLTPVASWPQALALPRHEIALAVLGIEAGFETADVAVISEQDILGERLVRAAPRRPSARKISSPR